MGPVVELLRYRGPGCAGAAPAVVRTAAAEAQAQLHAVPSPPYFRPSSGRANLLTIYLIISNNNLFNNKSKVISI